MPQTQTTRFAAHGASVDLGDKGWWTWVQFGAGECPARGPFRTRPDAEAAGDRFRQRRGSHAGTDFAAGSLRIVGPFRTRRDAENTSIGTYPSDLDASWGILRV